MPRSDSSETYIRAVRPKPSPADLQSVGTAGVFEVSRFSCMKFLGVPGVFDYAGLNRKLALPLLLMLPTAHFKDGGVRIVSFRSWIPTSPSPCLRLAESLAVSAQDSGPSRSLVFTRKALSSSTSCRFIPAH